MVLSAYPRERYFSLARSIDLHRGLDFLLAQTKKPTALRALSHVQGVRAQIAHDSTKRLAVDTEQKHKRTKKKRGKQAQKDLKRDTTENRKRVESEGKQQIFSRCLGWDACTQHVPPPQMQQFCLGALDSVTWTKLRVTSSDSSSTSTSTGRLPAPHVRERAVEVSVRDRRGLKREERLGFGGTRRTYQGSEREKNEHNPENE
ncbi:hypothetical protein C8R45DRAFT_945109 [Mycena sanguinolenta]|nr:hypothetical protein C8R45DRAFT_945109 [Mycena sanguinolenta]